MATWVHVGPAVTAAFLGSVVEFVEALTIVLAVGTVRGWRSALVGAGAGAAVLTALVIAFGPALAVVPLTTVQLVVGVLLCLFGFSWLRKAVFRAAGIMPLHDEGEIFARETATMQHGSALTRRGWDTIAAATTFKAVVLEGLEVVFIVLAVGAAGHMIVLASLGAAAAGVAVVVAGVVLHRPLTRVPENSLKLAVGILVASFGVFWVGEGLHVAWPGQDFAIVGLAVGLLIVSRVVISILRRTSGIRSGRRHVISMR